MGMRPPRQRSLGMRSCASKEGAEAVNNKHVRAPQGPSGPLGYDWGRGGAGLPGGGLSIHGSAWQKKMSDVSNVHAKLQGPPGQGADVQGVVDVLAARGVHAADGQVAQVLPAHGAHMREHMSQAQGKAQLAQSVMN